MGVFVWRVVWWVLKAVFRVLSLGRARSGNGRPFPVRVLSVQDGDSLIVRPAGSRHGDDLRLRLYAIDAPERDQEFGREARDYLGSLVRTRSDLMLEPMDTDRYGRLVGVLYFEGSGRTKSVNRTMVEQGLARWYSEYGGRGLGLEEAERDAHRHRRGVWSTRRSVAPWDHRRQQRQSAARGNLFRTLLLATVVSVLVLMALYLLPRFL